MGKPEEPTLTDFGQAAVALDTELKRFERLGHELEGLVIDSDKGLLRGRELLVDLASSRVQLEARMREMAESLKAARERNETLEAVIAARTEAWQSRQLEVERLQARFKTLGESVHHLNEMIAKFRQVPEESLSSEEKGTVWLQLNKAIEPLGPLVEAAKSLVQDAKTGNMKVLERNADTLRQTLQAARNRLNLMAERGKNLPN